MSSVLLASLLLGMSSPSRVKTKNDVTFAETTEGELSLDIYRVTGARNKPVLILVHGGSWRRGDKSDWINHAPAFAKAGFLVVVPNYRLAPPGGTTLFPHALDDLRAAITWARDNARSFGGDPDRVGMIGSSAGAHLTLLKAASGTTRPDAVALYSPPVDLKRLHRKGVARASIEAFLGCTPDDCPETYARASALSRLDGSTPPVFLSYSKEEVLPLGQARDLRDRLAKLKIRSEVLELAGEAHGLGVARKVLDQTIDFMRKVLSRR